MPEADLRSFLQFVRQQCPQEYVRLEREVSPRWELAAIVAKLEGALRAPLIECARVTGTDLSVLTNVCASLSRIARSMGRTERELEEMLAGAYDRPIPPRLWSGAATAPVRQQVVQGDAVDLRSEEHTSELQSQSNLVCRLLLEKKKYETRTRCPH